MASSAPNKLTSRPHHAPKPRPKNSPTDPPDFSLDYSTDARDSEQFWASSPTSMRERSHSLSAQPFTHPSRNRSSTIYDILLAQNSHPNHITDIDAKHLHACTSAKEAALACKRGRQGSFDASADDIIFDIEL